MLIKKKKKRKAAVKTLLPALGVPSLTWPPPPVPSPLTLDPRPLQPHTHTHSRSRQVPQPLTDFARAVFPPTTLFCPDVLDLPLSSVPGTADPALSNLAPPNFQCFCSHSGPLTWTLPSVPRPFTNRHPATPVPPQNAPTLNRDSP